MATRISTTIVRKPAGVVPLVTKGMGPHEYRVVVQGYGPISTIIQRIVRVFRGGRTVIRDLYGNAVDEFQIAARLAFINGKELLSPIFNKRNYIVDETNQVKVRISDVNFKSKDSKKSTSVFAKIIGVKRGL